MPRRVKRAARGLVELLQNLSRPWIMFFLRALQQQKRRLESRVEREKKTLGQKERGQVTIEDHLNQLIKNGLSRAPWQGKGTWYSLP